MAASKADNAGKCAFCFQYYGKGTAIRSHKTATRLLMHKECSVLDLGNCPWCGVLLDSSLVAVNYAKSQHSCVKCAKKNNWACVPTLLKCNRLSAFFKKYS
jgi:hypothetical protein